MRAQHLRRLQRYIGGFVLAFAAGFALWPGPSASASTSADDEVAAVGTQCLRAGFSARRPFWTSTGVWNNSDLVLVDTVRRALLPYSRDGWPGMEPATQLSKSLKDLYPKRIAARDDGRFVMQADAHRFIVLNRAYSTEESVDVFSRMSPAGFAIDKVYTWAPAGKDILAFADLKDQDEKEDSGIVRFPLTPQATGEKARDVQFLLSTDMDASRKYHRLGYSYITAIGDTGYFVLMGDGIDLWKHVNRKPKPEPMKALAPLFPGQTAPQLPSYVRREDFLSVMSTVEKARMPTGLYGLDRFLYLVWRQPKGGSTQWLLSKIDPDPRVDKVVSTVEIPSRANHLFVVPGHSYWAFVEKGPALGLDKQEVRSVLTIPSRSLQASFERAHLVEKSGRRELVSSCQ